ncbi:hypothetical protein BP6252_09178 [Coleophoma cylindrospora]|uniref:Uncharacterized protein n=1 Tax=Coleophoma cylindrospora TaxID=1849047 RepID=A0A3D8R165_9HELO|nr:hypothetical protein BP6252_09178 [Coleophoma cylindrospora]
MPTPQRQQAQKVAHSKTSLPPPMPETNQHAHACTHIRPSRIASRIATQRYITPGHLLHKFLRRIEKHDVEMLHGMYGLEGLPVLEPDHLLRGNRDGRSAMSAEGEREREREGEKDKSKGNFLKRSSSVTKPQRNTHILLAHPPIKHPIYKRLDLPPRLRRQVARHGIILQLELCPHNQVNNPLINAIRPIIPQDLHVIRSSKRARPQLAVAQRFARTDGQIPTQALRDDERHNRAILRLDGVDEGEVPVELGRDALEAAELVGGDDVLDVRPGEDRVGGIGRGQDADVFAAEVGEELRAGRSALRGRDVDLPVGGCFRVGVAGDASHGFCWIFL